MKNDNTEHKPWYKEPWPWVAIAIPGAAVIMGVTTLVLALSNPDPLVVDEGTYQKISSSLKAQQAEEPAAPVPEVPRGPGRWRPLIAPVSTAVNPFRTASTSVVAVDGEDRPVCCAGCQAVAQLIYGAGLGRYYQFRQELGRKAGEDVDAEIAAWRGCDDRESLWGTELADERRELLLQTEGIRCAACAWLIRSHMEKKPGVHSVQVDTATGYTRIIWSPQQSQLSQMAAALMELGYKPHLPLASVEEQGRQDEKRASMKRLGVAGLGMMQVMMYAVGLYAGDYFGIAESERSFLEWVSLLVTLPVLLYSGRIYFEGAWRSIRVGRPGMDVPVAIAITLAFLASCYNFFRGAGEVWFDSVVMFIFFLSLGRHIEMILRHRNLQAGAALARLLPEWAERIIGGERETIPASDLEEGDLVRVKVGEAFPADGVIRSGTSEVDEALLTGESNPVARGAGDEVIAGTINLSQPVEVDCHCQWTGNHGFLPGASAAAGAVTAQQRWRTAVVAGAGFHCLGAAHCHRHLDRLACDRARKSFPGHAVRSGCQLPLRLVTGAAGGTRGSQQASAR